MAPRCAIWGVLNVTPDSFSDGGRYLSSDRAVERAVEMVRQGATVIDIGGESTRPAGGTYGVGFGPVGADDESARVVPVIAALTERSVDAVISIDTTKATVARRAIEVGARIVNDVSCGASPALLDVVAVAGVELVLMHTRGRGQVTPENTRYVDVVSDVCRELGEAVDRAVRHGVARERIWIDPGLGFAKTPAQSLQLLSRTAALVATGHRVLVGPSRKSFIAAAAPEASGAAPSPEQREGGTAAAAVLAALAGAHAVRVHDVAVMRQAVLLAEAADACGRFA